MKRIGHAPVRLMAGLLLAAVYAMPQAYTISARPGAINYIEGTVSINGKRLANDKTRPFLTANDVLSTTDESRAEILLTPGVFLRVGQNSDVKMVSPRLTDTQVAIAKGEAMVEVAEISKDNNIQIMNGAASVRLEKVGLYRFVASGEPSVQVLDGKATVEENGRHIDLNKGKQTLLASNLKSVKFDKKADKDELYAWSQVRDEYVSAASYSSAKNIGMNSYTAGSYNGFSNGYSNGFGGWYGPGWAWNAGFNSYAWLPGDGAFFSPFGYGYYSPYVVGYAPVVMTSVGGGRSALVPVNPTRSNGAKPALVAGNMPTQVSSVRSMPVGAAAGHVSSASIAAAHGNVGHAMSSGGGQTGGYSGGGFSSGNNSSVAAAPSGHAASGAMSSGGGHSSGGGSHK